MNKSRGFRRSDPDLKVRLGKAVRVFRKHNSLTQAQLAESAGISQGALSLVESGERVDISMLQRLAVALDLRLSQLIELAERIDSKESVAAAGEAFARKWRQVGSSIFSTQ